MRFFWVFFMVLMAGCQHRVLPPVAMAESVDLPRFMGSWFVLAHIPLAPENKAWNAVEHYQLLDNGRVATTFVFRQGSAEGERKDFHPVASIDSADNAQWKMQFLWPFKADFRISWLDSDYQLTVIGRKKRDYVWVMARTPEISAQSWQQIEAFLDQQGYDLAKLRRVPQQWAGTPGYDIEAINAD